MSTTRDLMNRALTNLQLGVPSSQPVDPDAVDFVNASEYVSEEMDAAGIGLIHKLTIGDAEGTIEITENGVTQVGGYLYADVQVAEPEGTIEITENGTYNVSEYAEAEVNTPVPSGNILITTNGQHDVSYKARALVNVPQGVFPEGTLDITANGTYEVAEYENVDVNVPSEEPVIVSKTITQNGTYNASADNADGYSPVVVNVAGYPEPTGTINITSNGSGVNVKDYATANVNVPVPAVQASKTVTQNGEVTPDTGFDAMAKVIVNVPSEEPVIISKSITANGTYNASSDSADGYDPVVVNVPVPVLQASKTVTQNGTVTPDSGYDAMEQVIVNVSGGPSIAWGKVVPVDDSLTIDTGLTGDNIQIIFIAENDPRTPYATIAFITDISAFRARSYNGVLTGSDNLWTHFTPTWDNGVFTMTRVSGHNFRLSADAYYWYAIPLLPNPVAMMLPPSDDIERK